MKNLLAVGLVMASSLSAADLPEFTFENFDGRPITNASFKGKTTVVVPTYAKCVFACPIVTSRLTELDKALGAPDEVQYLHVSIQPTEDTSEEILSHFEDHEIDVTRDRRWLFANAPERRIRSFLAATGIEITRTPVDGGFIIEHTLRVYVVGPDGRTVATFESYFWDETEMRDAIQGALPGM